MTAVAFRPLDFGVTQAIVRTTADGTQYLAAKQALEPFARSMGERLLHWATRSPDAIWIAQRERLVGGQIGQTGQWQHISYSQALSRARSVGQWLLDQGLSAERPVAILSENDLDHSILALACLLVGVPFCAVSPAYSLVSTDFEKLRHVISTLTPGAVFVSDLGRYGFALGAAVPADVSVLVGSRWHQPSNIELNHALISFDEVVSTPPTAKVDEAMQAVNGASIAKFLFTSGSTKLPKAVINTHEMWCANQQQMRQSMPVLTEAAPVLVDWLPWNHTFGGNHNWGLVLYNGGTLYIDDGKPTPSLMGETLRNLREIAPTVYFNVPTGFEAIAAAMAHDDQLRKTLLSRVRMFFYAGAALAQPVWDSLYAAQAREIGERIVMTTGLGMTESGPFGIFVTRPEVRAGDLGLPAPALELKLVPADGKTEVRYRGPNITPGYWRNPGATADAFDAEGFFCTGDAVTWIDPNNTNLGLRFDGRIAEDFKLSTGTFVSVGPMRAKIIAAGAPFVQDVVITGLNRQSVGALVFATPAIRSLSDGPNDQPLREVLDTPRVRAHFQQVLDALAATATGSASRVTRLYLMSEAPSIDRGEVTDKGSINQRAVLQHRSSLVDAFDDGTLTGTLVPTTL